MKNEKKNKTKKNAGGQNPAANNDQLGENAAEHLSERYDNKDTKKRKQH